MVSGSFYVAVMDFSNSGILYDIRECTALALVNEIETYSNWLALLETTRSRPPRHTAPWRLAFAHCVSFAFVRIPNLVSFQRHVTVSSTSRSNTHIFVRTNSALQNLCSGANRNTLALRELKQRNIQRYSVRLEYIVDNHIRSVLNILR